MAHPVVPSDKIRPLLAAYRRLHDEHMRTYATLIEERQTLNGSSVDDLAYLCDAIYLMKKSREVVEDIRKELDAFVRVAEKISSLLWLQEGSGDSLTGAIAKGVPAPGVALSPPSKHKDPEAYAAIMNRLGVPEKFWKDCDVVKPHFPGLADYATMIMAEGGNLEPEFAVLKQTPTFTVRTTKHRDVDVDALCKQYPMIEED